MKKIIFLHKSNSKIKNASAIRAEKTIKGLQENGVVVDDFNLYEGAKLTRLIKYILLFIRVCIFKNDIYIYGDTKLPALNKLAKASGRTILERTELPYYLIDPKVRRARKDHEFELLCAEVDYFVTCSKYLMEYYAQFAIKAKFINIPVLHDEINKLSSSVNRPELDQTVLGYCGYMGNNKDGLDDLIEVVHLANKEDNFSINLYGYGSEEDLELLRKKITKLNIRDKVNFKGQYDRNSLIEELSKADILVLTRPNNIQAQSGFPSKITDYIDAAKPILCTDVGDISSELSKDDIKFCKAGDIESIKNGLLDIKSDYSNWLEKALKLKKQIARYSSKVQMKKVLNEISKTDS